MVTEVVLTFTELGIVRFFTFIIEVSLLVILAVVEDFQAFVCVTIVLLPLWTVLLLETNRIELREDVTVRCFTDND